MGCKLILFGKQISCLKIRKLCVRASVSTAAPRNSQFEETEAQKLEKFRIGVLGASGYTGSEVSFICSF